MAHVEFAAEVDAALSDARDERSPLRGAVGYRAVMQMSGMTGTKTRHLYNGLVRRIATVIQRRSESEACPRRLRYLEIGTWGGSSLVSSLCGNETLVEAVVVDNWSEFKQLQPLALADGSVRQVGAREVFEHNRGTLLTSPSLHVVEKDCFDVVAGDLAITGFDLYIYDGPHEADEHERAITRYASLLSDTAVVVIDDWNWEKVRRGTWRGLELAGLRVRHVVEEFTPGQANQVADGFWNGVAVFVVSR